MLPTDPGPLLFGLRDLLDLIQWAAGCCYTLCCCFLALLVVL